LGNKQVEFKKFRHSVFDMTKFRFSGVLDVGMDKTPFERTVEAESMDHGEDKVYSQLGSEHSVTRGKIDIQESEEL